MTNGEAWMWLRRPFHVPGRSAAEIGSDPSRKHPDSEAATSEGNYDTSL